MKGGIVLVQSYPEEEEKRLHNLELQIHLILKNIIKTPFTKINIRKSYKNNETKKELFN